MISPDSEVNTTHRSFEEYSSVITPLVETISEAKDIDPVHPDFSLHDSIDCEAVDQLLQSNDHLKLQMEFRIEGLDVTVEKDGDNTLRITVQD